jgi:hypothetical protein
VSGKKAMNDTGQLFEQPLFVLRYRRGNVFATMLLFSVVTIPLLLGSFVISLKNFPEAMSLLGIVVLPLVTLGLIFWVMDTAFLKEIRLYKDRIVRVSKLIGAKEIKLANADLLVDSRDEDLRRSAPVSKIIILKEGTGKWLPQVRGIVYDDRFADWEDRRKFKGLLAELSGGKIEDFEQTMLFSEKLVKNRV